MTDIEINEEIAKLCGWKRGTVVKVYGNPDRIEKWGWTPPDGWLFSNSIFAKKHLDNRESEILNPPDYLRSLDAIHEAETSSLKAHHLYDYHRFLDEECGITPVKPSTSSTGPYIYEPNNARFATARQRATAFLRTFKKL